MDIALGEAKRNTAAFLTPETERDLIRRWQTNNDYAARNDLVLAFAPLVRRVGRKYPSLPRNDVEQAGFEGLLIAASRFDLERSNGFAAYARWRVRAELSSLARHEAKHTRSDAKRCLTSLQSPIAKSEDGSELTLADVLADASLPAIEPDLGALSERDRAIIQARDAGKTRASIGMCLGISGARVGQCEARARSKIRGAAAATACLWGLIERGKAPRPIARGHACSAKTFRDSSPPHHQCSEQQPSPKIIHHRSNAPRLAELRGGKPLRRVRGHYGGPVIHAWLTGAEIVPLKQKPAPVLHTGTGFDGFETRKAL